MTIYLIHSTHSEASRNLVGFIGGDGMAQDQDIIHDGHPIRVLSQRHSVLDAAIPLYPVPACVVVDGGEARGGSVETWADCAAIIASSPAPSRQLSKGAFLELFTGEELADLKAKETAIPAVGVFWEKFRARDYISLTDPLTISSVQALEDNGFIAAGRAAAILGG